MGEIAVGCEHKPAFRASLWGAALGGRFVTPMCWREASPCTHATSRKGVSSTEMLILWLPDAIFRSDIYISTNQQPCSDTVPRVSL